MLKFRLNQLQQVVKMFLNHINGFSLLFNLEKEFDVSLVMLFLGDIKN